MADRSDDGHRSRPRTLPYALLQRREKLGWSQERCAEHLGTTQTSYHRWESGQAKPRQRGDLLRLARWLDMPVRDLLLLIHLPGHEEYEEYEEAVGDDPVPVTMRISIPYRDLPAIRDFFKKGFEALSKTLLEEIDVWESGSDV